MHFPNEWRSCHNVLHHTAPTLNRCC
jgi:hypothetical protein